MAIIEAGTYTLIHYGYDDDHMPQLTLLAPDAKQFCILRPCNQTVTIQIDTAQRFCTGWHDLATTISYQCPDSALLPKQYEQCHRCRAKTGFNPAFYNAHSISKQQAARNQLPHSLYLAHFGPGVIKVGITWAERGIKRLLEQGARCALIVKTFPTASVARHYEAKASKLPGIAETIQHRAKHKLLIQPYNAVLGTQELLSAEQQLIEAIGVDTEGNQPEYLDRYYIGSNLLKVNKLINLCQEETSASGIVIGMLGGLLIFEQASMQFAFPLNNWRGYRIQLSYEEQLNEYTPQQISLF